MPTSQKNAEPTLVNKNIKSATKEEVSQRRNVAGYKQQELWSWTAW